MQFLYTALLHVIITFLPLTSENKKYPFFFFTPKTQKKGVIPTIFSFSHSMRKKKKKKKKKRKKEKNHKSVTKKEKEKEKEPQIKKKTPIQEK